MVGNLVTNENFRIPEGRRKNSEGKMVEIPNLLKESHASSVMDMDTSKRNVPTI